MIPVDEETADVISLCGDTLVQVLQSKFGCSAKLNNMKHPTSATGRMGVQRYTITLPKGLTISVWKDDLTAHRVDAVVNAANASLQHGAGLARALVKCGGHVIQRESNYIIDTIGRLNTGDAVVTSAGSLPCKKIIHAVGPDVSYRPNKYEVDQAAPLLRRAVRRILDKMEEEKLYSVAIPALSSGLFNFPLPQCADIIVNTLKEYHDRSISQALEVRLVNNDETSVLEMERACREFLSSPLYSEAAGGVGRNMSSTSMQMANVTIHLKHGHIEEEKVDIIVNTIGPDLDLSVGVISKAILKRAGYGIQREIYANLHPDYGRIFQTTGCNLDSQWVLHTICQQNNEKMLSSIVLNCLNMANKMVCKSISFPAIGTGNLGFKKSQVAQIMLQATAVFAQTYSGSHMDVYFVIFPSDRDTYQAFDKQINLKKNKTPPISTKKDLSRKQDHGVETQCIELLGGTAEQQREAQRWFVEALCYPSTSSEILDNHIQYFGLKEHEELQSLQNIWSVELEEFFCNGQAGISIKGSSQGVKGATVAVQALCCQAQEDFSQAEEQDLLQTLQYLSGQHDNAQAAGQDLSRKHCQWRRVPIDDDSVLKERRKLYTGLDILRVERIENDLLKEHFLLKQQQLSATPRRLYQRVPVHFCNAVCRVGFQRLYSPPKEQKYGAGIYFRSTLDELKDFEQDEYIYIFEAQVLTGKSTRGSPKLIVPPTLGADPLRLYDSVTGGTDTHVIFNSSQALPEYLITCQRARHSSAV